MILLMDTPTAPSLSGAESGAKERNLPRAVESAQENSQGRAK